MAQWQERLGRDGFAVLDDAVGDRACDDLIGAWSDVEPETGGDRRRGGRRDLFQAGPAIRALAQSPVIRGPVAEVLGHGCFATRVLFFDKTPGANWKVIWHQDITIAVQGRRDVAGFGPWSVKAGVHHVQPPATVLEAMVAVRVHLDDCGPENGPLRVLPGSHTAGILDGSAIQRRRQETAAHDCLATKGSLLLMRPLLLHASSPAIVPGHRRVIHFEFACADLPGGLEWFERV